MPMTDDDFMNLGTPVSPMGAEQATPDVNQGLSPMSDDDFMSMKPDVQKDSTSFIQDPTWKNLGTLGAKVGRAGLEALQDAGDAMIQPVAEVGAMAQGAKPIITESVPETLGNIGKMALPFLGGMAPKSEAMAGAREEIQGAARQARSAGSVGGGNKPTPDQIRNIAGRTFDAAEEAGGALSPDQHDTFINAVQETAQQTPETEAYFGTSPLKTMAENAEAQRGKPLSFKSATEIDKELTARIRGETQPDGFVTPVGQKYTAMQDALHDAMATPEAGSGFETQNQAKALWAQQARMREVQGIMEKSANMTNPGTSAQVMYRNLAANGRRFNRYSPREQQMIQDLAAQPKPGAELMRTMGSRLLNIVGATHGPVAGVAANLGTAAARNLSTNMALQRQMKLLNQLGERTDLPVLNKPYQAAGGRVKTHTGKVTKKPVSYPAIEAMRKRP